jgi:type IV pilus assembly protein PilW
MRRDGYIPESHLHPVRAAMMNTRNSQRIGRRNAAGFTIVELMISATIALFLVGGALAIVARTKSTFAAQNQLAQLQDNERLAMNFMAQVIQSAGYFPNPKVNTAAGTMPVNTGLGFTVAGQPVVGAANATVSYGDTVTVRFAAGLNDNVYGCTGQQNTTVANFDTFTNQFAVALVNGVPTLVCTFTNAAGTTANIPLVTGVTKLVILYGVTRNTGTATGSCADTYLNAGQMVAANWNAVCTVRVTASFTNPLNATAPAITIQRVIAVMNTAGA